MRALNALAAAHLASWDGSVAPARDAASIIVTRSAAIGLEVLLMRRQSTMRFAAGMHVFPGGSVHPDDRLPTPWIGPDAGAWARWWRCDAGLATALVVAGVRETFEETGILLAGPDEHSIVGAVDGIGWADARAALEAGTISLGQVLRERELYLRADLLHPWAHWITPEFEPRRFDTRFFVAVLPPGQTYAGHGSEADDSFWIGAGAAVRAVDEGQLGMMVPTRHNLRELSLVDLTGFTDSAQAVAAAAARPITTVQPRVVEVEGLYWLTSVLDDLRA